MMTPKIRLKGFSGEWNKTTFGAFGTVAMCRRIFKEQTTEQGDIPFYKIGTFGKEPDAFISYALYDEYKTKYPFPQKGDILISAAGTIGRTVEYKGEDSYFQDSNIVWLKHSDQLNNSFLKHLYSIVKWSSLEGATIQRLYNSNILETEVNIPSLPEQRALATFFTSLDNQISAAEKRLASLKQVKAASLQAMFPQDGETTPKLRFKGFEGEWKKVKLGEVFEHIKNNSLSRDNLATEGLVMNVHYGDILIKFGAYIDTSHDDIPFIKDDNLANTMLRMGKLQCGDVIIADAAEDNTVGKCSELIVNNANIVSGLHTIVIRPKLKFASCYLGYYMNSPSYHNQLLPHIQGSKISSISKKAVDSTYINYPSLSEQRQIASYFTTLDRQITSQSSKILKLKQIKSACLDQMFV